MKSLSTKRTSRQNDFYLYLLYSVSCVNARVIIVSGEMNTCEKTCLRLKEGQQSCPHFALFCQRQEVTITGARGHDGEVESRLNGLFKSTSLVPWRCYCTWSKTAQVALIQRAHAAGPWTLSASQ